jgi:hypothetical protein
MIQSLTTYKLTLILTQRLQLLNSAIFEHNFAWQLVPVNLRVRQMNAQQEVVSPCTERASNQRRNNRDPEIASVIAKNCEISNGRSGSDLREHLLAVSDQVSKQTWSEISGRIDWVSGTGRLALRKNKYLPDVHAVRIADNDQNKAEEKRVQERRNAVAFIDDGADEEQENECAKYLEVIVSWDLSKVLGYLASFCLG